MTIYDINTNQAASIDETQQDPIKAANEDFQRDLAATTKFLFDIRCGLEPEIMYDPITGWELFMDGHGVVFPLESCEDAVNMILQNLTFHYRRLSAALGDPDQKCNRAAVPRMGRALSGTETTS